MAASVSDLLAEKGIRLRSYSPGQRYTTCPQCSEGRKGANKKKLCLSVACGPASISGGHIEQGEAVWNCHHCGFKGGVGGQHQRASSGPHRGARHQPGNRPAGGPVQPRRGSWWS